MSSGSHPGNRVPAEMSSWCFSFSADFDGFGVVDFGAGVVHGYVLSYLVEGSDEGLSLVGVGAV